MKLASISAVLFGLISIASAAAQNYNAGDYGGNAKGKPKGKAPTTSAVPPKASNLPGKTGGGSGGGGGAGAPVLTGYPTMDVPPPPNQPFFRKIDMSKIPNLSLRKAFNDCPPVGSPDPNCVWSCTQCINAETDFDVCPKKGDWAITFDDGPASASTGSLLNYLGTTSHKATFFVVGSRVLEFPETLKKAFTAGHQIGVHTWSHSALTTQTNEQIIAEMLWTEKAIFDVIGVRPKYMRPPFGDVDNRVRNIMSQLGYKVVLWNRDTGDFNAGTGKYRPEWIAGNFSDWVANPPADSGSISLDHDIHTLTVKNFPAAVQILEKANQNIQPFAGCLGDTDPYQKVLGAPAAADQAGADGTGSTSASNVTDATATAQSVSGADSFARSWTVGSFITVISGLFAGVFFAAL